MNYVAVSGGADSTALALLLWERGEDFEMVFSDTGGGITGNLLDSPTFNPEDWEKAECGIERRILSALNPIWVLASWSKGAVVHKAVKASPPR